MKVLQRHEVPDYATAINGDAQLGWYRCLLYALVSQSLYAGHKRFYQGNTTDWPRYVEPVTDTLESTGDEMVNHIPTIFLLSAGADPM